MEPLFFKAENEIVYVGSDDLTLASMEPLFFKAENSVHAARVGLPVRRFNGAAFFQSGK